MVPYEATKTELCAELAGGTDKAHIEPADEQGLLVSADGTHVSPCDDNIFSNEHFDLFVK